MEFEKRTKIMEFQNIHMDKSWKFFIALRAFHLILIHCLRNYICYYLYHDFWVTLKRMQGDHIQNTKGVISVLKSFIVVGHRSWKNDERVMENHGI